MSRDYNRLVEYLKEEIGEELRAVGSYDQDGYYTIYFRDDVAEEFSKDDIEKIHHEMVLKGLGNQHIESLFNDEELNCSIYIFDSVIRLHFVYEDYRGCYISFDFDDRIDTSEIVNGCRSIIQ